MGRSPCCDKAGLKKGPWTSEEDQKLLEYIEEHGHGSWRALPAKAGLQRCGKSCRLRWTNYLRPDIKRGKFSLQEEQTIIQLHALLGNRWSAIATHLSKRTDNEIKNHWNTHLKKRLAKMGIDPITHKPKNDALQTTGDGQSKNAAKLSHLAQWESARLEAEARLVKESKIRSHAMSHDSRPSSTFRQLVTKTTYLPPTVGIGDNLESPTSSTLTFSETAPPPHIFMAADDGENTDGNPRHDWNKTHCLSFTTGMFHDMTVSMSIEDDQQNTDQSAIEAEGFTDLLLNGCGDPMMFSSESENKNYWNSILNLFESSPSDDSPLF